ncbi:MAG: hypothetical protein FDZ70_10860, partial [Actinobacteria bacterium]
MDAPAHPAVDRDRLVELLFEALGRERLEYAVLRNHEDFPHFGHDIDLVMRERDLGAWVRVASEAAAAAGWAPMAACGHWATSPRPGHRIHIY